MKKTNIENEIAIKIKFTTLSRNIEFSLDAKKRWVVFVFQFILIVKLIFYYFFRTLFDIPSDMTKWKYCIFYVDICL